MATNQPPRFTLNIEDYRLKSGITTLQLSDLTGIPRTTLRRRLAAPGTFTIDELATICDALNIPDTAFGIAA